MDDFSKIKENLNRIELLKFEDIKCGDMLHYQILETKAISSRSSIRRLKSIAHSILDIMIHLFTKCYSLQQAGSGKTFFLYSTAYGNRKDQYSNFKTVSELVENRTVAVAERSLCISLKRFKCLALIPRWNRQIREFFPAIVSRAFMIRCLFAFYLEYDEIQNCIDISTINSYVSFCDVHPIEYLFTNYFNRNDKLTITLQHGVYNSIVNSWVFEGSESDYLFGHGEFTIDESKRVKQYGGTVVPVGLLSYIGKVCEESPDVYHCNTIGLILDGDNANEIKEQNIAMLKFVEEYCRNNGYELVVKLHPTSNVKEYIHYIDNSTVKEVYKDEIGIIGFSNLVDIVIGCNSTAIIEMIYNWKPTLVYSSDNALINVYKNVKYCSISNAEDLDSFIKHLNCSDYKKELTVIRDYFCAKGEPKHNYIAAFRSLGLD